MSENLNSRLPSNFQEWRECITVRCRIALTPDYINTRLRELRTDQPSTRQFVDKFGTEYTTQVIAWFEQALIEGIE